MIGAVDETGAEAARPMKFKNSEAGFERCIEMCIRDRGHAEAVEHGHMDHETVCGGQAHAVADALAVVHDVAVREHDALGESCGAGGVLHVADVVGANIGGHTLDLLQRHELGACFSNIRS